MCCVCVEGTRAPIPPNRSVGKTKNPPRHDPFFWQRVFIPAKCFFIPAVSPYENCKRPLRNNTQKRENCKLSKCNFHISLQFSYQFAILMSVYNSHVLTYGSYVDICNFHISLRFSYQFAIFISVCNSHVTTPSPSLPYVALHVPLSL